MTSSQSRPATTRIEPLEHRIAPAVALVDLGSVNGTDGFKINGVASDDLTGVSVSAAGDINGDRRPDFIIGARAADAGAEVDAGTSYVVFGSATGFGASFDLSSLDGTNGFRITGDSAGDLAGQSVSNAGDINGDGFGDLIVGAHVHSPGGVLSAGAVYIVYGKRSGFGANVDLATATGVTKISGEAAEDLLGFSVSAAGDVNGDGRADIVIGAPSADSFTGAAYVIFGRASLRTTANFSLGSLNGVNGFQMNGGALDDQFGASVSGAGDVNRDGFADVIIGAYGASTNGNDDSGAAYVVFGRRTFAATFSTTALTGTNGFKINGADADESTGEAVSGAGDINRDGFADLLIGARTADRGGLSDSGTAYVLFGKRSGFTAELDLSAIPSGGGFEIPGHEAGAQLGSAVNRAGDLNKDGFADILLGAGSASPGGASGAGSAYAIFGKRDGFAASFDLAALDGIDGFRIDGDAANDDAGRSVSAAGDLNGDGLGDILVGAPGASAAYVLYGTPLPVKISSDGRTATLTDTDGDTVVVRVNKGRLGQDDFTLGAGDRGLLTLSLGDDGVEFQGASLSITATSAAIIGVRDGRVNVGGIDAGGIDLVNVTVEGDLGLIDAGDTNLATTGLAKLSVRSLGAQVSTIAGRLGSFSSVGDVLGVVEVDGTLGGARIGGDLDGSVGGGAAGLLRATGSIGNVSVTGSIIGGADDSGLIAGFKLGKVSIGADLQSADAVRPVSIFAGVTPLPGNPLTPILAIASLSVKGDVLNARILADTDISRSQINSNAAIGNVSVRGTWTDSLLHSTGNIGNVTVVGDFTGTNNLGIVAGRRLGALHFGGDVQSVDSLTPLLVAAVGDLASNSAAGHLAMASITVKGDVTNVRFLAGYGQVVGNTIGAVNRDASIGAVVVDGTWNASSLVAGVNDLPLDGFGQNDIAITANDKLGLIGRIAAVVIRGAVTDNGVAGNHFGITAERIGAANISGVKLALTSTAGQLFDLGSDTTLVEV